MSKKLDEFQDFGFFEILGIFEKKLCLDGANIDK